MMAKSSQVEIFLDEILEKDFGFSVLKLSPMVSESDLVFCLLLSFLIMNFVIDFFF